MPIFKHIIAILLATMFLFFVLVILEEAEKKSSTMDEGITVDTHKDLPITTVTDVSPTSRYTKIYAFGEVKPRWKTSLTSKQAGEVLTISKELQDGKRVQKGDVLLVLDNRHYQSQLAEAQYQVAQAELSLYDEKQQASLVKKSLNLIQNKRKVSAFALRIPQIKVAQAQLHLAKTSLKEIQQKARYNKILAPYDGIIISRSVNQGDVVNAGQQLAEIMSSDSLEIILKLDNKQWQLLGKNWQNQTARIFAVDNNPQPLWTARIDQQGRLLDDATRQYSLYLSITSKEKPFPGSFVRVEIGGKKISGLLDIPASALSPDGYIWFIDEENRLNRFQANIAFSKAKRIYVYPPKLTNHPTSSQKKTIHFSVVIYPLSYFMPGMEVQPRQSASNKTIKIRKLEE